VNNIQDYFQTVSDVLCELPQEPIEQIVALLRQARAANRRIFVFGNGGSSA
jgi:phosphoheptose isomerase